MTIQASIIISSYNRLALLRRTLWSIATNGPSVPYEVIIVDDGSNEDILGELKLYSARFRWKFIRFEAAVFEQHTGLKKFLNNPSVTNNIGFRNISESSRYIFQQGNEVIAYDAVYDRLIHDAPKDKENFLVMSTTYDVQQQYLDLLDQYGSNITPMMVAECGAWPLQSKYYQSLVTNYISLASRAVWEKLDGYNEQYYGGISSEDSDFVRRARQLPNVEVVFSEHGVSLHQYHKGKTMYYSPPPSVITNERWEEGCAINHAIYYDWDGSEKNPQKWPSGRIGTGEIIQNGY
jgi:glycosyltransferase involved in cell wall biosynthesis